MTTNVDRNRIIEIANLLIDELNDCDDIEFADKVAFAVLNNEKLEKVGR